MGSPCLFTRQRALKIGQFYWLRVKSSKVLVSRKTQSSVLKVKPQLLTYAVLLHFSCFWLLGCGNIALFRTVPWLAKIHVHPVGDYFPKKIVLLSNFFSPSNMFFIRLFLAYTWKKIV